MMLETHKESNIRKTWLFLTVAFLLFIGLGWLLAQYYGNPTILFVFVGFSIVGNSIAYWKSDRIALAVSGAHPADRTKYPRLFQIIEQLCMRAELPMPRLFILEGSQINAFATGRNPKHAAIAVTQGALEKLNDDELTGVCAHELSHVQNRDILLSTFIVVLAGAISVTSEIFLHSFWWGGNRNRRDADVLMLVLGIAAAVLAPIAATMIRLAVSRKREYLADASGAELAHSSRGLASALEKISHDQAALPRAHQATAHLYLSNPFRGTTKGRWLTNLFFTHPPLAERIKVLRALEVY